jgi:pyruvate dehydrogenase E1 component
MVERSDRAGIAPRRPGRHAGGPGDQRPWGTGDESLSSGDAVVDAIQDRILWLAARMIHEANAGRPKKDGIKVGGHQASSASVVSILTALYLRWLRPDDLVSIKPHASPAYHALRYLLGDLDRTYLTTLRAFGGLQSYPSRTKDPDRVDFSTGSVGLGAVAPLFASLADRYLRLHFREMAERAPERRFVAVVGDAELDEGNIWEAAIEDALRGLGNVTLVVDLNRQSLDRVVPGIRIRGLEGMFAAAGWQVLEAKYGRRLRALFAHPNGEVLRQRIDAMTNEEYQVLIRKDGTETRARLLDGVAAPDRDCLARSIADVPDDVLPGILADLGGHDVDEIVSALDAADGDPSRPSVIFAYTIKGWGLPFAGDTLNHSAHLSTEQIETLKRTLGGDPLDDWAAFPADSPEGRLCAERGRYLRDSTVHESSSDASAHLDAPVELEVRIAPRMSTQQAFGDALTALAKVPSMASRLVTASPDVSVSTSLGGWINRVGVFAPQEAVVVDDTSRPLTWSPKPAGQHIELGISEMNLFLWLSQFGLTAELFGEPLVPIGTVYDPFICRGLDALVYALYVRSRFILAATPSGITLAPEGGAHQSTITPSIGIELPELRAYEPAFAQEAVWCLIEGIKGCLNRADGFATYLRLSTRPVDQSLVEPVRSRLGDEEWRRQALAGGYRLLEPRELDVRLPVDAPAVTVVASGAVVSEAVEAVRFLVKEEVAASLVVVTSADRLSAEVHARRLNAVRDRTSGRLDHLATLLPPASRRAPIVTVLDGASHALSFIGAVYGAPVVPLGVDSFGQSGTIADLYGHAGIDAEHIIEGALYALELGGAVGRGQ